ncbi:unnamed protein product [Blepharisma stoltei]|uniref:Uncharacterized protein n=1 Tax=Blepharisma stoltei TaxID=1481888 RepID=A0AAU9ICB9_9CILI|nr:unnamed protein product [Blepharisma stoltei]
MWTSESQLKHLWNKAVKKNAGMKKPFVLRINAKYCYVNEKLKLVGDVNHESLSLWKKWENKENDQTKWFNKAQSLASQFQRLKDRAWGENSFKSNEERKWLKNYLPEIIIDNPATLASILKAAVVKTTGNISYFNPTPPRSPVVYYIADKYNMCIHNTFFPYRDYYYEAKKEYDYLPKAAKELYEKANELDTLRNQAESIKVANAEYLNYLNNAISWREVYKRPLSTIFGENLKVMSKISLFLLIKAENLINHLMNKIERICRDKTGKNKKNKVIREAVNDCIKEYPQDKYIAHYTICGENLNNYTPTLSIIEQSILHEDSWYEATETNGEVIDFQDFPLIKPNSTVNLGHGIVAKIFKIEDIWFDSGVLKRIRGIESY